MLDNKPVKLPAGYAPAFALGMTGANGSLAMVDADSPLPVTLLAGQTPAPLQGTLSASGLAGPYMPLAGRPVMLQLAGAWSGHVRVTRSTDGGATRLPLTMGGMPWGEFSGNACEAVWEDAEAGAQLYLDAALTSGTLAYRLSQ